MRVVPAILTDDRQELTRTLKLTEDFSGHNQVDIMDGEFVPSRSVSGNDLVGLHCESFVEAHLMVEEPLGWLDAFYKFGARRIIFHYEIKSDKLQVISKIKQLRLSVGLAVNPSTQIGDFLPLVDKVDTILFLSVIPGFYGSEFIPEVLEKIKEFRKIYPKKAIGIDGGIKLSNIKQVSSVGIDFICVGSAILKSENPAKSYKEFSHILEVESSK